MSKIFVQIASYRDPQLIPTLESLIDNCSDPSRLHIGICWQHGDDEPIEIFLDRGYDVTGQYEHDTLKLPVIQMERDGASLSVIDLHYHKTNGACWARNAIQQLYDDEAYTMQLDSHHRFVDDWDVLSVDMLESLRDQSKKPLLTAYIPSFDPEDDPGKRVQEPWKMDFDRFIPEGAVFFLPSTIDDWKERDKPMRGRFYSAHFAFADGSFATEVQHDPEYFFHGEEISIAVRAFTHGYDLYHPHRVIAWHEYTRKGRIKVWDDHTTNQKNKGRVSLDWVERNDICHRRNRILFGMDGEDQSQIDFGKYGFGAVRTVREYEEYAGISFQFRGVQQVTLDRLEPELPPTRVYESEQEWADSFVGSHDIRICFHKSELGEEIPDDYNFWYIGAHDAEGNEIARSDWEPEKINRILQNEWIDERLIFLHHSKPVTYTVWPHSLSQGWGNKIDKPANG